MAIDEPRLKPLVDIVEQIVKTNGINKDFILDSETEENVIQHAVREIVSNVSEFENWYFRPSPDEFGVIEFDARRDRLQKLPKFSLESSTSSETLLFNLVEIVQKIVEIGLKEMRALNELSVEPDVSDLVNTLVSYIVNWQNWYYDYKMLDNNIDWLSDAGTNDEIYREDYGDSDSMGVSNLYEEKNIPYPSHQDIGFLSENLNTV